MRLSIVTLNFNKKELTLRCIASIVDLYGKELNTNELEIIIVDNKSSDDSVPAIKEKITREKYKNITLLTNKENAGFSQGCNFGASYAKGKYILFLNNDTIVKDRGIINMVGYMDKHPQAAILGGALYNFDGTQQQSVGKFYTPLNVLLLILGLQRFGLLDKAPKSINEVDWVKGALLMIRKEIFERLGGFDNNIFMYTEDMELCYRAKKAGYQIYFYPDTNIIHEQQGSSNRTFAILNIYKNLLYFYKKHRSTKEYIFLKTLLKLKALLLYTTGRIIRNPYLTDTYEKALKIV